MTDTPHPQTTLTTRRICGILHLELFRLYAPCTERAVGYLVGVAQYISQEERKQMKDNGRTVGTVQWFSRVKGYGFIRPDGQEEDVFVHYSAIRGEGYRNLREGQRVEFTMEDTSKGPQAVDVVGID